jgi:hypothetical protein
MFLQLFVKIFGLTRNLVKKPELRFKDRDVCYHCRFYNHGGANCRRHPNYVKRAEGDWCGEFKPRTLNQELGMEE